MLMCKTQAVTFLIVSFAAVFWDVLWFSLQDLISLSERQLEEENRDSLQHLTQTRL